MTFIRKPAGAMNIARRTTIYGVGINDAYYVNRDCPLYAQWKAALQRAYCPKWKAKYPCYEGVTIDSRWLKFSTFQQWADLHNWQDKSLDKDLKVPGNKVYGPDFCLWVTQRVNCMVSRPIVKKTGLPVGVDAIKNRFMARTRIDGKNTYIGLYDTPAEAANAFNVFKANLVREVAQEQDTDVMIALLNVANLIESGTFYA